MGLVSNDILFIITTVLEVAMIVMLCLFFVKLPLILLRTILSYYFFLYHCRSLSHSNLTTHSSRILTYYLPQTPNQNLNLTVMSSSIGLNCR